MKKILKLVLAYVMIFSSLGFVFPVQADEIKTNYALQGVATADRAPIDYWGPDKLIDGIVNRDASPKRDQSRWSSESGAPAWVLIDLGQERSFDEVLLAWEVAGTVEDFHIDVSSDGNDYSTVYDAEAKADGYPLDTRVNFDSEVSGRYVKVTVDKLTAGTYPSVSLYEIEVIGTKLLENLSRKASVSSNGDEGTTVRVENINDGDLNTRWGSSYGVNQKSW